MLPRFFLEEEGQTLVEYGLLISFIAMAVIVIVTLFGKKVSNHFNIASNQLPQP